MKTLTPILLRAILAFAAVSPLYSKPSNKGYYDSDGYFHMSVQTKTFQAEIAEVKVNAQKICQSSNFNHGGIDHILHVCPENGKQTKYCYLAVDPLPVCCRDIPADASPIREVIYQLDNRAVSAQFFPVGKRDACFRFEDSNIDGCCSPRRSCVDIPCQRNMHPDGTCLEGYQPDDCCNCLPQYFRSSTTQRCIPVCPNCIGEVTETGCTQCRPGYLVPTCCDCAPGYLRTDQNTCELPSCPADLTSNSLCSDGQCTCHAGFVAAPHCCYCENGVDLDTCDSTGRNCRCRQEFGGPDCCECADGYRRTPQGNCEPPSCPAGLTSNAVCTGGQCTCSPGFATEPHCCYCENGVDLDTCDSTGLNCRCRPGFGGPDCCQCADGYRRTPQGNCEPPSCPADLTSNSLCSDGQCTCHAGFAAAPHCCYCENGVDLETCDSTGQNCRCRQGFGGPDCCQCADGYRRTPQGNCELPSCPAGITSNSMCTDGQCTCRIGFATEPHCCYCENGVDLNTCDSTGQNCLCRQGFSGPDCCECADGYQRTPQGYCEPPECPTGLTSRSVCSNGQCTCRTGFTAAPHCCYCENGVDLNTCDSTGRNCMCRPGFTGPDCCQVEITCSDERQIYFAIDMGSSNRIDINTVHCQLTQLMGLMINSMRTTNFELVLFPNAPNTRQSHPAVPLFKMNATCEESIGKLISMEDAAFSFVRYFRSNSGKLRRNVQASFNELDPFTQYYNQRIPNPPYHTGSRITTAFALSNKRYPAKALDGIRQDISNEVGEIPRVVVLFITGNIEEWGERQVLQAKNPDLAYQRNTTRAVEMLTAAGISVVVAVNVPNQNLGSQTEETEKLLAELEKIPMVHIVNFRDTKTLQVALIEYMRDVILVICPEEAERILHNLQNAGPELNDQCVYRTGCLATRYLEPSEGRSPSLCIPDELRCGNQNADKIAEWDLFSVKSNDWHRDLYPEYKLTQRPRMDLNKANRTTLVGPPLDWSHYCVSVTIVGNRLEEEMLASVEIKDKNRDKLEKEILAAVEDVLEKRLSS